MSYLPISSDTFSSDITKQGFSAFSFLNRSDLKKCQDLVSAHVSQVLGIKVLFSDLISPDTGLLLDIQRNKSSRILDSNEYDIFSCLASVRSFLDQFPEFEVCEVTDPIHGKQTRKEMYFRVVTPMSGGEIRNCHIDSWFDEAYQVVANLRPVYKVWVSLMTEPPENGLMFLRKEHWSKLSYEYEFTEFGPRPRLLNPDIQAQDFIMPPLAPGDGVIFSSRETPHLGSINLGKFNRVSFEIALRPRDLNF